MAYQKVFRAGNKTRYTVDYSNWLLQGESLTMFTAVLDPEFTATVTDIVITIPTINSSDEAVFYLEGGSVDEVFTLNIQATTSRDEVKNDAIGFSVVAP